MLWGSIAISSREASTAKSSKQGWELVPDFMTHIARTEGDSKDGPQEET